VSTPLPKNARKTMRKTAPKNASKSASNIASKLHFEDFTQGRVAEYGPRLVTREQIVAFATEFDPQPFHLDEQAARATMFDGLAASGWHNCALLMRIISDGFILGSSFLGSPGVDDVRWFAPVRPDDRLTVRATVLETRSSTSRPELGFVKFMFEMFNAAGDRLMTLTSSLMFGRRLTPIESGEP
jgi:acyl dehydratase